MSLSIHHRRHVRVAGLASVLALAAAPLTFSGAAWATDIPDAVTSVETQGAIRVGDSFTLVAQWAVPDHSQPGDTFTLELPPELSPMQTQFDVLSDSGAVVATANVQGGNVVVTLSDYVTQNPVNLKGQLRFNATVNESATPGTPIVIAWGTSTTTITPSEPSGIGDITQPSKFGWVNDAGTNSWSVQVPGPLTNVVVSDTPQGHQIDCSSLRGAVGVSVDGAYPTGWEPRQIDVLTCDPAGWTVALGDIEANQLVLIQGDVDVSAGITLDPADGLLHNGWSVTADQGATDGTGVSVLYGADGAGGGNPLPPAPEPTPEPTVTPTPEPTVTPEPTATPTPDPTPTPEPSVTPTPEPTETSTPEPPATPEPSETSTPEPSVKPTPEDKPSAEPTAESTTTAAEAPSPAGTHSPSPAAQPSTKPEKPILVRTGLAGEDGGFGPTAWIIGGAVTLAVVSGGAWVLRRRSQS